MKRDSPPAEVMWSWIEKRSGKKYGEDLTWQMEVEHDRTSHFFPHHRRSSCDIRLWWSRSGRYRCRHNTLLGLPGDVSHQRSRGACQAQAAALLRKIQSVKSLATKAPII